MSFHTKLLIRELNSVRILLAITWLSNRYQSFDRIKMLSTLILPFVEMFLLFQYDIFTLTFSFAALKPVCEHRARLLPTKTARDSTGSSVYFMPAKVLLLPRKVPNQTPTVLSLFILALVAYSYISKLTNSSRIEASVVKTIALSSAN